MAPVTSVETPLQQKDRNDKGKKVLAGHVQNSSPGIFPAFLSQCNPLPALESVVDVDPGGTGLTN